MKWNKFTSIEELPLDAPFVGLVGDLWCECFVFQGQVLSMMHDGPVKITHWFIPTLPDED